MSKTERPWTPGPWVVDVPVYHQHATGSIRHFDVHSVAPPNPFNLPAQHSHICMVRSWGDFKGQRADARLIAAAPDLFEALAELVAQMDNGLLDCAEHLDAQMPEEATAARAVETARAALAKALGEVPTP